MDSNTTAVTETATPVLKTLKFGIEIESIGLSKARLAAAIHSALPGSTYTPSSYYSSDSESVAMADGRTWKVVRDGSLSSAESGEIVSPVLTYGDLDALQNVVRAVRTAGARVDGSCGIHIHVDGARFDARSVVNLVKLVHRHEGLLQHVLGVSADRSQRYCKPVNPEFLARLARIRPTTLAQVNAAWYGNENARPTRYDHSRYHGLNLNSLFYRGTVEFRYFAGTLHAGKIKANIQLALGLAARALTSKAAVGKAKPFDPATARYTSRIFIKLLGLTGDEFKTCRHHMTAHLSGTSNFRGMGRAQRDALLATETAANDSPNCMPIVEEGSDAES